MSWREGLDQFLKYVPGQATEQALQRADVTVVDAYALPDMLEQDGQARYAAF